MERSLTAERYEEKLLKNLEIPKWWECFCDCHKGRNVPHIAACCVDMCRVCGKHIGGDFDAHVKSHGHYHTLPTPK